MKYGTWIDNAKSLEWGLNIPQAYLFSWIYSLPSWADKIIVDGEIYYFASKNKVIEDIPLLTTKKDTVLKHYSALKAKGLIDIKKLDRKDYIKLTEKAKEWNNLPTSDHSEKNPTTRKKILNQSEINPGELGKKSELNSEIFPTNYITNIDTITKDNIINDKNNSENKFSASEFNSEPKKQSRKKEKSSAKKEKVPAYAECVEFWLKEFHTDFEEFTAVDGRKMKSIISKLSKSIEKRGNLATTGSILDAFRFLCINLPDWYKTQDLAVLDSKYNSIISEIKLNRNGKGKKQPTGKDVDVRSALEKLSRMSD